MFANDVHICYVFLELTECMFYQNKIFVALFGPCKISHPPTILYFLKLFPFPLVRSNAIRNIIKNNKILNSSPLYTIIFIH